MHNSLKLTTKSPMTTKVSRHMKNSKFILIGLSFVLFGCNQQPVETAELGVTVSEPAVEDGAKVQTNLPARYSIGSAAKPEVIAGWDIDVRPDGLGLPEGSGSVEDGEEIYEEKCAMCHGSFGEGEDQWPKLTGGAGTLTEARPEKTIGSFWPYASTLWDYINRAMPFPAPQSLEPDEVYAITAYVLNMNEIVDDDFVLTKENFATVEMPNKDGFYVDDRPDTNNTRCMKDCKDAAQINVVLGPKYSLGKTAAEETKPAQTVTESANQEGGEGKATYESVCKVCHGTGIADAPKLADAEAWSDRLTNGKDALYANALNGLNGMPAKGGRADLSDDTIKAAVDYMLSSLK